ncbi:hypothetical protein SBA7_770009 [Candidatus Sulfotelmatobacter sp. SbA7]|nr:hypothetical protein SBA7_770009 [Candidatus Sulfotelmatobacter sp. SbA7]
MYISLPAAGDTALTGTCWMTFAGGACVFSCAATVQVNTNSAITTTIAFLIDIIDIMFPPGYAKRSLAKLSFRNSKRARTNSTTRAVSSVRFAASYRAGSFHSRF